MNKLIDELKIVEVTITLKNGNSYSSRLFVEEDNYAKENYKDFHDLLHIVGCRVDVLAWDREVHPKWKKIC